MSFLSLTGEAIFIDKEGVWWGENAAPPVEFDFINNNLSPKQFPD